LRSTESRLSGALAAAAEKSKGRRSVPAGMRKERSTITIYLMSGVKLTGRIRSFDKYSVVLETNNQEQLIF